MTRKEGETKWRSEGKRMEGVSREVLRRGSRKGFSVQECWEEDGGCIGERAQGEKE